MLQEMDSDRVRAFSDEGVEVPAQLADGSGYVTDPLRLRAGSRNGRVTIRDLPPIGAEVPADDLIAALEHFREPNQAAT